MTFRTNPGTWKLVCFGCVRTLKSPKMEQYRRKLPKIASYAAGNFRNTLGCKPGSQHDLKNALVPAQSLTRGEMLAAKLVRPWTDAEKKVFHDKFASFGKNFKRIATFIDGSDSRIYLSPLY
jgi:hypothetical protein